MKKNVVYGVVIFAVVVLLFINFGETLSNTSDNKSGAVIDLEIFEKFNKNAADIENEIREAERIRFEQYGGSTEEQIQETLQKLENDEISYKQIFADTFVAGDSLVNSLEIYGVLNESMLATQVSASLSHLEDSVPAIISANPQNIILHYGLNVISTQQSQLDSFISDYSELIIRLQESLPDSRIIISGIFPVDTTVETRAQFKKVSDYNKALSAMCRSLGVEFLDSANAFKGNEDYYAYDGMHLSLGFYTDIWLPYIIENKGILG